MYIMPMITTIMVMSIEGLFFNVTQVNYLSFFEVISQVVEKFVKHFKPWEITESNRWRVLSVILHHSSGLHENQLAAWRKRT